MQVVPLPLKQSLPSAQIHAILSEFAEEDDAVSKVQLLIKYARMPPRLSQAEKTAANRVMGCTTQVQTRLWESDQDAGCTVIRIPNAYGLQREVPCPALVMPFAR